MLDRESILSAKEAFKVVEIPELGGSVAIRKLSFAEILSIRENHAADTLDATVQIISMSVCDENRNRILSVDDARLIVERHHDAVIKLMGAISDFNGLSHEKESEAEKN